ncbi:plasmid stabilization protein [Mycolicibacterium celeriflavum]|uniref:Toxin RelE n=1 Tax=Mycolicibacterium celeriflavum TaxID=1249101 RepID=A0A1X0BVZ5_MYCCF|nr:type II toxin-antitoxin system RelE/ParE family toxin [Mycolicibacterium celeriflavum]MCV7238570.1 type II toxin-antitoxin system RelE/ParE family toxin [Mycolicibacterium celeriflavum]OBG16505.1 plasmid stabilization protein [Mycolicibacterium celeriflavum]ORA48407.1 plasmid stabilization protein [Mycolicibacterium celeriflavum]BBY46132.1 toxin RelE [Mycolicibacterium celeriflavum]
MTYRIELTRAAKNALTHVLPEAVAVACWEFIRGPLAESPRRVGKPLRGQLEGRYSARRGEFRVIYQIFEDRIVVRVIHIAHRRDVYR